MNSHFIFIDFDKVLVDSLKSEYITAKQMGINWDLEHEEAQINDEGLQLLYKIIYDSDLFFNSLTPFTGVLPTLRELKRRGYHLVICTIGTPMNISKKALYIERVFSGLYDELIFMHNKETYLGKGLIDMEGAIFIDDKLANLQSTNAKDKILVGITDEEGIDCVSTFSEILDLV